ncbi:hypothetical protein X942_5812 [Burkholderia pseudomallei MSHR5596]|nr:hypothetical protein X942_5812 [Burkholderia pseudomallei MSHR5596]
MVLTQHRACRFAEQRFLAGPSPDVVARFDGRLYRSRLASLQYGD